MSKKGFLVFMVAALMVLVGGIAIFYSTERGPWTMVDTVDYFDVARNLAHGHGLVVTRPSGFETPMTVHPPFYSIVLAWGLLLNIKLLEFVRMLNIILFIVLILVLISGTYRLTSSATLSIGLGIWALTNHAVFRNYTAALSEPLFLTLGFVSIYLMLEYVTTNKSWLLLTGALLAGLSLATRYSGAAFLVVGFLVILMWEKVAWGKKIKDLITFTLISSAPILIWMAYLRIGFPGNNPGAYELVGNIWEITMPFRLTYIQQFWSWLGLNLLFSTEDYRIQMSIVSFILFILGLAVFFSVRISLQNKTNLDLNTLFFPGSAWGIFALTSTAILLFSYIFVYAPKPWLDERLYSPIQMGTVITIIFAIYYCSSKLISRPYKSLPVLAIIALMITANTPKTIDTIRKLHNFGEGYTSKSWGDTMLIDTLQNIPAENMIVTNDTGAIFFFLGRTSVDLIPIIEETDTNEVPAIFQQHGVYIVLFERRLSSQIGERYGENTPEYIQKITGNLSIQYKGSYGAIYYVK
jgi:4-amino-4-deoxy-L-arabinose transferase-like glycosyltransferase